MAKFVKTLKKKILPRWQLYLLLLLPVLYILIFCYVPMGGIVIAFKKYNFRDGIFGSPWVGFKHFETFFKSYNFKEVLRNTLTLSIYDLVAGFPMPILFALMLNALPGKRYKKIIQTVTYVPHFFSTVIMVGLLMQLLNYRIGLYGSLYALITKTTAPNILTNAATFPHLYVWSGIWQNTGYSSILYIAALTSIDPALHEAATIDGAGRWQRILHIDLPGILPTINLQLIFALGGIMNVGFEKVLLLQNDLNLGYSEVISTYSYKVGLASAIPQFSYSAAIGLFNTIINFILLVLTNKFSKKISGNGLF